MLKVYFAGSIRAGRNDSQLYHKILKLLQKYGTVLTEHVGDPNMDEKGFKKIHIIPPIKKSVCILIRPNLD